MNTCTRAFILLLNVMYGDTYRVRPRCFNDFHFTKGANQTQEIYKKSWKRNCSQALHEICRQNITISYFEMMPFTTGDKFSRHKWPSTGIMQCLLSVALGQCCGNCLKLNFNKVTNRSVLIDVDTKEASDIIFPVFTQGFPHHINATLPVFTIKLLPLSSAMFITKSNISAKLFATEILKAIIDLWPLLGVSLLLAFVSGVVIWIIDTWWNKEHFPRRFLTGSFEGFWWAFISMTTVGYGDRTPLSVPGRIFAVFWILCGITIIALMTAALTEAISTVTKRQQASVHHGSIGLLNDHIFEKSILMRGNAKMFYKKNISELHKGIINKEIDGILIDSFTAKTSKDNLFADHLYLANVIHDIDQSYLGVSIYDEKLYYLIDEYFEFQRASINDFIYDTFQAVEEIENTKIMANLIFTTESGLILPTIYTSVTVLVIAFLIGGMYELYVLKKTIVVNVEQNTFQLTLKSIIKEEKKIQDELSEMLIKWDKHLRRLMKNYSIQGSFSKTSKSYPNVVVKITPPEPEKVFLNENSQTNKSMDTEESPLHNKTNKANIRYSEEDKIEANGHYKKLKEDYVDKNVISHSKVKRKTGIKKKRKVTKKPPVEMFDQSDEQTEINVKKKTGKKPRKKSQNYITTEVELEESNQADTSKKITLPEFRGSENV